MAKTTCQHKKVKDSVIVRYPIDAKNHGTDCVEKATGK